MNIKPLACTSSIGTHLAIRFRRDTIKGQPPVYLKTLSPVTHSSSGNFRVSVIDHTLDTPSPGTNSSVMQWHWTVLIVNRHPTNKRVADVFIQALTKEPHHAN